MTRAHAIDRVLLDARPPDPTDDVVGEATPRILARFAERLDAVDEALRGARPGNPSEIDAREATKRVLARVALLTSGDRGRRRGRMRTALRAAAALLLALGVAQLAGGPSAKAPLPEPAPAVCDALAMCIEQAIHGDALARHEVLTAGGRARGALLDRAAVPDDGAHEALGILRALGGIRRGDEARQLRAIAHRPDLRDAAIDLLATAPSSAGARELGTLLGEVPAAAEVVVSRLLEVAERGRRSPALAALLRGASAGHVGAAVAAFRVARASSLERVLDALPPALLEDEALAAAVREAPVTTRARLVRRAAEGDGRALRLATTAGLDGIGPALRAAALGDDPVEATWAVRVLARRGDIRSWTTLADAREGASGEEASIRLARMPRAVLRLVERRALRQPREREELLATLGGAGEEGVAALERLASRPALRAPAIEALASATSPGATDVLAVLAVQDADGDRALRALGHRLSEGDTAAGRALVDLARRPSARQALRMLERHASGADEAWLGRMRADDTLPSSIRRALERAARGASSPARAEGTRTVRRERSRPSKSPIT